MMVYQKPEAWTRLVTHSNEHLPVKQKNKEVYYMPCIVCHTILHCHQDEWWGVGEGGEEMQRDFSVVGFYVCLFYVFFFHFCFCLLDCLLWFVSLWGCGRYEGRTRVTGRKMELGCMMWNYQRVNKKLFKDHTRKSRLFMDYECPIFLIFVFWLHSFKWFPRNDTIVLSN